MSEIIQDVPFWTNDPNILIQKDSFTEIFPTSTMSFSQKLNALSRFILLMTVFLFFYHRNYFILVTSVITLVFISVLYHTKHRNTMESFSDNKDEVYDDTLMMDTKSSPAIDYLKGNNKLPKNVFKKVTSRNPFSNPLIAESSGKPAPPIDNTHVKSDILYQSKQMIQKNNSSNPHILDKLFDGLYDELSFEQSLRPFYSVPNDQGAFAKFCYGSKVESCKSGNMFSCAQDNSKTL